MKRIPEMPLDPPEDRRAVVADCVICGAKIREYDDMWELPDVGCVCERCIEDAHRIEVTLD